MSVLNKTCRLSPYAELVCFSFCLALDDSVSCGYHTHPNTRHPFHPLHRLPPPPPPIHADPFPSLFALWSTLCQSHMRAHNRICGRGINISVCQASSIHALLASLPGLRVHELLPVDGYSYSRVFTLSSKLCAGKMVATMS